MKKLIIALLTVISTFAFAQKKSSQPKDNPSEKFDRQYGIAGCGLGSVLIGKRGAQIFASTTNGSWSNQMFGISSGTLNCVDSPTAEVASRMDQFIMVNRSRVQGDIARGQGESVAAIGQYMGCTASSNKIAVTLKSSYTSIFTSGATVTEVTDGIITAILANPELAKSCQHLG
ncbi:MAG: DUF3015 domain-containing protein [Bdellovibrionales bacterium]|nr:DUF3015 domain-containing protein [Bdellovibrionales bacterium]